MSLVSTRPAVGDDLDFAFHITETAMRDHVIQTWGKWDPVFQFHNHRQSFDLATHRIVLVDGHLAGVLAVAESPEHVQLEKIYLLPEHRNRGIGSQLFAAVKQHAEQVAKPLRLRVLRVNTAARRFYQGHGCAVIQITTERVFMEWAPAIRQGAQRGSS